MIISHKHKFIFIKTKKTAGTSIEIALSKICGPKDIITPISLEDELYRKELGFPGKQNYLIPFYKYSGKDILSAIKQKQRLRFYNHMPASEIKNRIPENVWNEYYKFSFERNPFDKFISLYYWKGRDEIFGSMKAFIESGSVPKVLGFDLYTLQNKIAVDKIYKFENLSEAIDDINNVLQLSDADKIALPSVKTKSGKRKSHAHYREVLTDFEIDWIKKTYSREMTHFGYEF